MTKKHGNKVSIVGGAGAVGATAAYALTMSEHIKELVLVDINKDKAEGEALDLNHGAAFISPMKIKAGDYEDTKDSDIVVITAGIPQKPGQTRLELVGDNVKVMESMVPEIVKYSPNSILLVVSNPVDVLSYVAYKVSGFPKERVIGSGTVLDTSRFKYEIGRYFNVDPRIVDTYILGEHGDSSFPVWSKTNINSIPIAEYAELMGVEYNEEFRTKSYENVKDAAYEVINKKRATYYAIGLSIKHIVESILTDARNVLPVSTLVNDYYDADDLYTGIPCIVGRNGLEAALKVTLNEEEIEKFNKSSNALAEVLKDSFKERK